MGGVQSQPGGERVEEKTDSARLERLEQLLENLSLRLTAHEGVAKNRESRVNTKVQLMEQYIGIDRVLPEEVESLTAQIKDLNSRLKERQRTSYWRIFGYQLTLQKRW
jgi:flagellar capping protein FliD